MIRVGNEGSSWSVRQALRIVQTKYRSTRRSSLTIRVRSRSRWACRRVTAGSKDVANLWRRLSSF